MNYKALRILPWIVCLSACSGLPQMQGTVSKFDQAAHSASTAQMALFHQVQTAECNRMFYNQAYAFATAQKDKSGHFPAMALDVTASSCDPQELTNAQVAIRQKLLDAITLYADSIQTIATGKDNATLNTNSQELATNLQKLATQQGITSINAKETAALNAAVATITGMILDNQKYKDIKAAAAMAQAPLTTIISELKNENTFDATGLKDKADVLVNEYQVAVSSARDKRGPASFLDIVASRNNLQSAIIAPPDVDALNKTLDSLVAANQALAQAKSGGAVPQVSDLISRAQQADKLFKSSQ